MVQRFRKSLKKAVLTKNGVLYKLFTLKKQTDDMKIKQEMRFQRADDGGMSAVSSLQMDHGG